MAEKVKKLNLERDYKKYLYFIDGEGNVCQKSKSGEGESTVPGHIALHRIPWATKSAARDLVSPATAALVTP